MFIVDASVIELSSRRHDMFRVHHMPRLLELDA
jgi:hypothetical protein